MEDWKAAKVKYVEHVEAITKAERALNDALLEAGIECLTATVTVTEGLGANGWPRQSVSVNLQRIIPLR